MRTAILVSGILIAQAIRPEFIPTTMTVIFVLIVWIADMVDFYKDL